MKRAVTILLLGFLSLLSWPSELMAQETQKPEQGKQQTTSRDWTYSSRHMPLDLKWRRHLESNLRWMIARQLGDAAKQKPHLRQEIIAPLTALLAMVAPGSPEVLV